MSYENITSNIPMTTDVPDSTDNIRPLAESHYAKAQYDHFDYLVVVVIGDTTHYMHTADLVEHEDGFVTIKPPFYENDRGRFGLVVKGQLMPCPRGISVRKECIMAVIDAPNGS